MTSQTTIIRRSNAVCPQPESLPALPLQRQPEKARRDPRARPQGIGLRLPLQPVVLEHQRESAASGAIETPPQTQQQQAEKAGGATALQGIPQQACRQQMTKQEQALLPMGGFKRNDVLGGGQE